MYIREMNIEVKLSMQKIGGNKTRKLTNEEIDWLLNKNQERFIRDRIRPRRDPSGRPTGGFEILQDDLDAIKTLVKTGVTLPAYVDNNRRVRCPLPGDYAYLTQDESVIKRISELDSPPDPTDRKRYLLALPLKASTLAAGPYYNQLTVTLGGNIAFDLARYAFDHDSPYQGFKSKDEVFNLPGYVLQALIDAGWDAYWESYQGTYIPKNILIASPSQLTGSITIDGTVSPGVAQSINSRVRDIPAATAEYQANRLTASNVVSSLLEVAFFGTQPEFPISEIADRSLYIYANKTFIVSNAVISYVRKPRRISLILGTDSELAPEYHQLICDLTVEYIKGMIADPNWEVKLKDNMTRTTLGQ